MINSWGILKQWDLSSVLSVFTGPAPLGPETAAAPLEQYPSWLIRQANGLTETCTVVCSTSANDVCLGSSGSFLPGYSARLLSPDGAEITAYNQPGELLVMSPSVSLGYLNNENADKEIFIEEAHGSRWLRTGDEAFIKKAPSGIEHVCIVDRIKELIKSMQVAPAELEAHILAHPAVADMTLIPVQNDRAGKLPNAFVVKSEAFITENNNDLARSMQKHVEAHKGRHKWLQGGVEFVDVIPRSPTGKILRHLLRDRENKQRLAVKSNM